MINTSELKDQIGKSTEQIESKIKEAFNKCFPYYTNLELYQRGILILSLITLLLFTIYYLTKPDLNLSAKKEAQIEERILRQMAFYKRLRE